MTLVPRDNRKTFWSEKAAKRFANWLSTQGIESEIWNDYDKLNKCTTYTVMWDNN